MNLAFDLTTPEGRKNAIDAFDKYGWILAWPTWLIRQAYKVMTEGAIASTEAQKNAAVDLIRAGRDHGVDKMTIKLQRTAGIDLGSEVDGIPIKLKVGDSGTVEIAVQYRDGRRFDLPGDADSDWREAKQQLLSESGELSGRSTITAEELSEIPARTEEIALPAEVTSAETELAPIEEGQPASHEAYRKAEPGGELPPLTEPIFESPVEPAVEQTAETLEPSVLQTPEIAPALAAVPMPPEAARLTEPSDEEIRLRAYFISEHRRRCALPGDADSDWREAKQQLVSKSGELSERSTITAEERSEIPARTEGQA
jgi:hypothetical protein